MRGCTKLGKLGVAAEYLVSSAKCLTHAHCSAGFGGGSVTVSVHSVETLVKLQSVLIGVTRTYLVTEQLDSYTFAHKVTFLPPHLRG